MIRNLLLRFICSVKGRFSLCQVDHCWNSALCHSGDYYDHLVCSEHFSIVNGEDWQGQEFI